MNLKSGKKVNDLIKNFSSIVGVTLNEDKVAVLYITESLIFTWAVFKNGKLLWKTHFDNKYIKAQSFEFMNTEEDTVRFLEEKGESMKVYTIKENSISDYVIKGIRNIIFQYPMLAYVWGTRELWIQDLNNNVSIYYFDATIAAMENISNIRTEKNSRIMMGIIIDYGNYIQSSNMSWNLTENTLFLDERRIEKNEYPTGKLKGYYQIDMMNPETKSVEDSIMLHTRNYLVILSLKSKNLNFEIKKTVNKANVIHMKKNKSIIFWNNNGDKLEMMRLPYDPSNGNTITKAYEANDEIKLCKLTIIDGKEFLALIDEPNYVKILKIEDSNIQKLNKISIYKDYFVHMYFSAINDIKMMKNYGYCKGMMYTSSGTTILQEKGMEKKEKFNPFNYRQYSFNKNTTKFPMCSEDFILYSLSPEFDNTFTHKLQFLLLGKF